MTIKEGLEKAITRLKENKISEPIIKARILLAHIMNKPKEYLIINDEKELSSCEQEKFEKTIKRLTQGEPLQYITGKHQFMKMEFIVNKNVFISSPETEVLVEEVIDILKMQKNKLNILDLCTGSGVIAISIAKNLENMQILATDISEKALEVARQNLAVLTEPPPAPIVKSEMSRSDRKDFNVKFLQSNLFENIQGKFDLIVSNPPYGEREQVKRTDIDVWKQYEPILARDGGIDGLDFYRKIISEAYKYLEPEGYLCLEIGHNKQEAIIGLIKNVGKYNNIYLKQDLEGNDRVIICKIHL